MSDLSEKCPCIARSPDSDKGFSFIEVVMALALTTIVLGAVFGLLARGMKSTPVELERSDLQAQARHALERMSNDILLAGTDLPLEFPAFTPPGINPVLDRYGGGPDAVEIIGHFSQDASGSAPLRVVSFDGQTAFLETVPDQIERGQLVLIYDDEATRGSWMFGIVSSIQTWPKPALTLVTAPGAAVDELTLPLFIDRYNRSQPSSGFLTPVTVVTYVVDVDSQGEIQTMAAAEERERLLWRQINWGPPVQVAFVEDLQIRFFVGGTVVDQAQLTFRSSPDVPQAKTRRPGQEQELKYPPVPQPNPNRRLRLDGVVRGVRLHITTRSHEANLEGSTVLPEEGPDEKGYLRASYSTRVSTRNLLFKLHARQDLEGFN